MKDLNNQVFWTKNRISNWFLVKNGDIVDLIDTGAPISYPLLKLNFFKKNLKPHNIILTHGHADHAGNILRIHQEFKSDVYAHPEELDYLHNKVKRPSCNYKGINPFGRVIQFGDMLFGNPVLLETKPFHENNRILNNYSIHHLPGHF